MAAVFIAQSTLQDWADAGKVRLTDTVLTLIKEQREVSLTPAVRFTQVIGGDVDPHKLLGKVKSKAQLDELGAEHYMDSVLCGEVAYQVVEGFLGDLMASRPIGQPRAPAPVSLGQTPNGPPSPPPAAAAPPATAKEGDGEDDAAALSRLFLDTVR